VARVLIIDDDASVARTLALAVKMKSRGRHEALMSTSYEEARARIKSEQALDVILVDLMLPPRRGDELFPFVRLHHPRAGLVLISAELDVEGSRAALEWGVPVFPKPDLAKVLIWIIEHERARADGLAEVADRYAAAHAITGKVALVLRAAVLGLPDQIAAEELSLTLSSYRTYWSRLRDQTDCDTRPAVVAAVFRFGRGAGLAPVG